MVNDVMGDAEGDDYGDYGNEGFTRENEAAYDFMWTKCTKFQLYFYFNNYAFNKLIFS